MYYVGTYIEIVTVTDFLPFECADMLICQSVMHTSYLDQAWVIFYSCNMHMLEMCPKITFFTVFEGMS